MPQSILDKVGPLVPSLPLATPRSAILHQAHPAMYLAAQIHIVTPSKEEAKTDGDQLLPQKSHWESLSKPNATSRAPDAVLRQPPTSYCCFYMINSIVLWFVIFLGMKIILAQIYRDHNAISKQTLHLLARSFVNTTKHAELCTQFA